MSWLGSETMMDHRGMHRLAGAVLLQAIEDLSHGSGSRRADAVRWMENTTEEINSFAFWCQALDRHPDKIRRLIEGSANSSFFTGCLRQAS